MKEEDEKLEGSVESGEEGDRDFVEYEYAESYDETEEEVPEEEDLEGEEDRPHVEFEPKKQSSFIEARPPQETGTMTEKGGFCVLSYMALHKDLRKCRYCNKYIDEDAEMHLLSHKQERRAEKEEEDNPFIAIRIGDEIIMTSTKDDNKIILKREEDFQKTDYKSDNESEKSLVSDVSTHLSHASSSIKIDKEKISDMSSQMPLQSTVSRKSIIGDHDSSKTYRSSGASESTIKGRTTSTMRVLSMVDIKNDQRNLELLKKDSIDIKKKKTEEELLKKQKQEEFSKLHKTWLKYYN